MTHTPEQERAAYDLLTARVREHGYTLTGSAAYDMGGLVTFTCGMTSSYRHPEFVLTGLPATQAEAILTNLAAAVRDGSLIDHGDTYSQRVFSAGQFASVALRLRPMDASWGGLLPLEYAVQVAAEMGAAESPRFLQVLYPDADGLFPDQAGCRLAALQPDLTQPCTRRART